jgi:hypothetical protein
MNSCKICGNEARFLFKTGNWYCCKSPNSCPVKRKNSGDKIKSIRSNLTRKSYIVERIGTIKGQAATIEKELERRQKISYTMKNNPEAGGLREGSGRGLKCWYESKIAGNVYIRSSYELEYVKWLDDNNIKWKANLIRFPYEFESKIRNYIPDFYLIDEDCYVEIKGYETEKDKAKQNQFPYKLKVLKYEDLYKLGLNIKK